MASSQGEPPRPEPPDQAEQAERPEQPGRDGDDDQASGDQVGGGQAGGDQASGDQAGGEGRGRGAGLVIARPFGIPVYISPYWIVIAAFYVILYANDLRGAGENGTAKYVLAIAFVILLYLSVLLHELSHSIVARAYRLPVRRIVLYPLSGATEIDKDPQTPLREFFVSGAGPGMSLALGAVGWGLSNVFTEGWTGELAWQLMWVNLIVGALNLVPGLPLDGGRMLHAVVWKITGRQPTATIAAAWAGRVFAVAVLVAAVALGRELVGGIMVAAIWGAVIAAFMWIGAGQSIRATRFRERIPALQARRLARKAVSVQASTPLAEAIRRADEARARAVVVVDHDNTPIAIVNEAAVMATPPQRRPWIDAGSLARSIAPELVLPADISGMALLEAIKKAPASEYLLVEPTGEVYGVLAAKDLDHVFAGV